jgi:ERF superfamily
MINKSNILPALIAAKKSFTPLKKDKTNPFHKSKYTSLDAVLASVEPALLENGLVLMHKIDEGHLITILYHESGEEMASTIKLPESIDPQKIGSALTYYRRYAICGLLSICADEDDDAQSASDASKKQATVPRSQRPDPPPYKPVAKPVEPTPKETCQQEVISLIREIGWSKAQSKEWAANFSAKPKEEWTLKEWESAREKLIYTLDDVIQQRDLDEDLAASGHTI